VRHFRAPRRERTDGSWQRQSEQSGGNVNTEQSGRQHSGGGGQRSPGTGKFFPPGHAKHGGQQQQWMGKQQPGPVELRNLFSALSALNGGEWGEQGLQAQH
jgi:hypothetical protein